MKRIISTTLLMIGLFVVAAYAHHASPGVDRGKSVTLEGTVKQFKWGNPHSWLDLEVPNAKGGVDLWSLEMTSPAFLVRAGWKSTSLKFGDKVKVVATPLKSGEPGGLFVSVTLPDGKTLAQSAGGAPPAAPAPASNK